MEALHPQDENAQPDASVLASGLVSHVANSTQSASVLARESISQAYSSLDALEKFTVYFDAAKMMKKNIISKNELQKPLKEVLVGICTLRGESNIFLHSILLLTW